MSAALLWFVTRYVCPWTIRLLVLMGYSPRSAAVQRVVSVNNRLANRYCRLKGIPVKTAQQVAAMMRGDV